MISRKPESTDRLSGFVHNPNPPFGIVPEPAADFPQHLPRGDYGLGAGFLWPGEFGSLCVGEVHTVLDMEKISRHPA
jgi:hypothetical protein